MCDLVRGVGIALLLVRDLCSVEFCYFCNNEWHRHGLADTAQKPRAGLSGVVMVKGSKREGNKRKAC